MLLATVVDQQAVCAKPDPLRPAVGRQHAVVYEVTDRHAAGDLGEVGDEPPVAAPLEAFAAHHRLLPGVGRREQLVDGAQEVWLPHVSGVTAEGRLPPCHVR